MTFPTYTDQVVQEGHENVRTFEAAEDVTQGQLVKLDTNNTGRTVEPSDTDGEQGIGYALYTRSSGQEVPVAMEGAIVRAVSSTGTIASGDYVASHGGTGDEGELDTAASGDAIVGYALEDDTGTGTEGSILVYVTYGQFGD